MNKNWNLRSDKFNMSRGCKKLDFHKIANHMDQEADEEDLWREHWTNEGGASKEIIYNFLTARRL
jgi:hypothetical protein